MGPCNVSPFVRTWKSSYKQINRNGGAAAKAHFPHPGDRSTKENEDVFDEIKQGSSYFNRIVHYRDGCFSGSSSDGGRRPSTRRDHTHL